MSRIGRQPISVPSNVQVTINDDNSVTVKGPKGELARQFPPTMQLNREDGTITVARPNDEGKQRALHGLSRSLLNNMVVGVTTGFTKTLEVQGVGYRAQLQGSNLQLALGFSHPVWCRRPRASPSPSKDRGCSSRASIKNASARLRPTSASSVRPSRTRARAFAIPANGSAARLARPERWASK